jgi:hypothetical protein
VTPDPKNVGPTYDDSEWPLFVVTMPPSAFSAGAFDAHLETLREPYRRGQPFAVLIVMGDHPPLPAAQRKAAAEAMILDKEHYPKLLRAKAIVIRSSLERGVVTAIRWVANPDYPFAEFESTPVAKAWLLTQLQASTAGASPGPAMQSETIKAVRARSDTSRG